VTAGHDRKSVANALAAFIAVALEGVGVFGVEVAQQGIGITFSTAFEVVG
jgi:formate-dependent phosphoribosylglycinamide formyltransferase (GAR transformylase)